MGTTTDRSDDLSGSAAAEPLPTIACDLTAIDAVQRDHHLALANQVLTQAPRVIEELLDGYAFSYDAEFYSRIVEFIANERLCCPFFTFTLEVTPDCGPIWLRITGAEQVKVFIATMLDGANE